MITFPAVALFIGSDLFDFHGIQGTASQYLWDLSPSGPASSDEPMSGRNGDPHPNQEFLHRYVLFLGVAMMVLSLWGLWLGKP
jgi:hypothetical protein